MAWDLMTLLVAPFVASVTCWWAPVVVGRAVSVAAGLLAFVLAVLLIPSGQAAALGGWVRVDPLSVVFLVAVAFLYLATMVFAVGYVRPAGDPDVAARYNRRLFAGLNLFCWAMVVAPLMSSLALLWVAIEVTTVISALLVAIDDTARATEAAWKYVLIASMGLGIALFATIVVYYAGSTVLGNGYELFVPQLLAHARAFPPQMVRLAFVLAVLGFGTKVGFVPVHTWLPDAHSEAPTPVSALLSGALLAVSFYAVLRYFQVAVRTVGGTFPRDVLLAFGIASLALAAFTLSAQRDLKRLLAYSSVEHMGILAIGMSFAAPIAVVGVLLQVLAHAAAKGTAFFGAGSVVRKFGTKDMARIRGGIGALPWSGPLFVLAVLALSAMPPFGIFRSEFLIVEGGLSDPHDAVVAILVVLVLLAFAGLSWFSTRIMMSPSTGPAAVARGEPSAWIVGAMLIGVVALVVLGVHPPGQLSDLLTRAAAELGVPR
ncbi:MAG: proton-conducting transporter membrane subunit [Actinomycetota bacterium]|jgi:hydrogenase-4 component F|nr:proton-conducting transporter membrane subunit [Actinomycetota bacterium]MDA8280572.1 proton-conducting transporter membrane subunit [Actinomycetota bacterium]